MNVFEAVKQSVSTREVAEMYGIKVRRNGMACCPFHDDRNPSMKLDNRFHCFGCGADGDAIDFVAKLYGLSLKEAAVKIADDFGISYNLKHKASVRARIREPTDMEKVRKEKQHLMTVKSDYRRLLFEWERTCSPVTLDEEWNPLFVEALHKKDYIDYLLDLLTDTPQIEMKALVAELGEEVRKIERRITELSADSHNRRSPKQLGADTER